MLNQQSIQLTHTHKTNEKKIWNGSRGRDNDRAYEIIWIEEQMKRIKFGKNTIKCSFRLKHNVGE